MGLIIVATRLPSLLKAWDTSLARVLVGDLPLGMSFLSFRVCFLNIMLENSLRKEKMKLVRVWI